jgi:hypothetical protein
MHEANGIPLGHSLLLPVGTVNSVQTLKVLEPEAGLPASNHELCHCTGDATSLKVLEQEAGLPASNHELCHCTGGVTHH